MPAPQIKHAHTAAGTNDPTKEVSVDRWNADHTITGLPNASGAFLDPTTTDYDLFVRKVTAVSAITVGFVGDSITAGTLVTTAPPTTFASTAAPAGVTITANNQGVSGATSADWNPTGGAYYAGAKTAFQSAGVKLVHVMLGTNDSKSAVATSKATYRANLRAMCDDLIGAGFLVALSYPPFLNTTSGVFNAASPGLIQDYCAAIDSLVDNSHIFRGDTLAYNYFQTNTSALQSDGVHPTQAGSDYLAGLWADALEPLINGLSKQTVIQRAVLGTGLSASVVSGVVTIAASASGALDIQSVTGAATVTPTFSNDLVKITAQDQALTLANWSGTASEGRSLVIRIKDNGTARAISYGTKYRALGVTLPTTTVISKTLYLGCIYNSTDDKIDVVSVAQEA